MKHFVRNNADRAHRKNLLGLTVFCWMVFSMGCASPLTISPKASGNTGTLSIAIPHIAAWAAQLASPDTSGTAQSRAYIVADKVMVEVKDAGGAAVIAPTTINLTMVTDYSPAAPFTPSNITGIPVGSDYTVVISVYNNAVSSTEPVVRGQASGITVTEGQTTPVAITCVPVSPETITVDNGPWTKPLSPNGEHWYALPVTSGVSYYFVNNGPFALFNAAGAMLSSSAILPYVATYTGTVYIGVIDFNGFSSFTALGSSVLNITTIEPKTNEGTIGTPETLTLNTPHNFLLGPSQGSYSSSYYSFTTTDAGEYVFDSDLVYLYAALYSDAAFSTALLSGSNSLDFGLSLGNLAANTTYYLKLRTGFTSSDRSVGRIMDSATASANHQGQGTATNPVPLILGATHTAQAGTHFYDSSSYYRFTTGAGTDYAIDVSSFGTGGNELDFTLYNSSLFSYSFTNQRFRSSGTQYVKLTPNTTYYLKASNDYNSVRRNSLLTFDIGVRDGSSTPGIVDGSLAAPEEVLLNTDRTFKVATYGSGYASHYRFTTAGAGDYAFDTELNNMDIYLYSNSEFSTLVASSTYSSLGMVFKGLAAGTTYYLKLLGNSSSVKSNLGQIVDSATMAANYGGDGNIASPASLTVGTPLTGKVGRHSYDVKSFYSFTTGPGLEYSLSLTDIPSGKTVIGTLHSNSSFTNQLAYEYFPRQGGAINLTLSPNTTYYFQTFSYPNNGDVVVPYTISVLTAPSPSFLPLPVTTAGASYLSGTIANPYQLIWYEADVVGGTTYTLKWDDWYQGSGTYTRDVEVSAYHGNRSTSYFTNADSGYSTLYSITIPAEETKLYVMVRSRGGSSSTGTFGIKLY